MHSRFIRPGAVALAGSLLFIGASTMLAGQAPAAQAPASAPTQAEAAAHAIIQGAWQLNAASSSSSGDLAGRAAAAGQSTAGRRGGGRRGGSGGGSTSSTPQNLEKIRALVQEIAAAPGRVTIIVKPDEVTVTYDTGQFLRYMTSNQQESHDLTNGTIKTRTRWDGSVLTQDIDAGNNLKFLRTYAVSGDQLIVTIVPAAQSGNTSGSAPASGQPPVEKRSVYDPVK